MSARSLDEGVVRNKLDAIERAVKTLQEVAVACRAEVLDQVLDDELPRYAAALERLGR